MKSHPTHLAFLLVLCTTALQAADPPQPTQADRNLADYFRSEVAAISSESLSDIHSLADWTARREQYRQQLADMLGLWPPPPRTDLKPVITGRVDHPQFTVENLHFQSQPGLYVTANLYLPKNLTRPAPAILYVCGHANVQKNGTSYGAKAFYQPHGTWFARNGYVCLIIDTLQLGEIQGIHHGTYREKMWWWHSRGYTPAGVEAWNGIRALDYLQSRPEVDPSRLGMTGRSGGGAYTWWVAALDDRIKCAVPVAGITDLQNHVVNGCVEGHCDCMFMVNTYRWDFAQVAALLAPRPLLIANTDKDDIFPLDGVVRLHSQVRRIYQLHKADDKLGLLITEGPHKDTQDLQVPTFRWFDRFLKNEDSTIQTTTTKFFEPEQLKVLSAIPADQINTRIQESFVHKAPAPPLPASPADWTRYRDECLASLRRQTFNGWPTNPPPLNIKPAFEVHRSGLSLRAFDFTSQNFVQLRLYLLQPDNRVGDKQLRLHVLDDRDWDSWRQSIQTAFPEIPHDDSPQTRPTSLPHPQWNLPAPNCTMAFVAPRGIGPTRWTADEKRQTQVLRRFALIGQTLDGMRVWDIRRAIQAIRSLNDAPDLPIEIHACRRMASLAIYASLFEPRISALDLSEPPTSHDQGPELLNVLRILDTPAAVALAAERSKVTLHPADPTDWLYPQNLAQQLHWPPDHLTLPNPATQQTPLLP